MEKKTNTEIAENVSSGAEKVERIERENAAIGDGEKAVKLRKTVKKTGAGTKRTTNQSKKSAKETVDKMISEDEKATKRVEIALAKKRAKAEKAEAKRKAKEAKKAEAAKRKERLEEAVKANREAFLKRRAELKAKLDAELLELENEQAERKAKREERRKERLKRSVEKQKANGKNKSKKAKPAKKQKTDNRRKERRSGGNGGWIAAVITLGAVSLALTTVLTVGAMDMSAMNKGAMTANRGMVYELIGVMENVDEDLDRARISNTPAQQSRILTDLLVQARLAELDLEKLPVRAEDDANFTAFLNRTAQTAEDLLAKLRKGEKLNAEDRANLQTLYEINHGIRGQLEETGAGLTDKDMKNFLKGAKNKWTEMMDGIERATLPENAIGSAKTLENAFDDFALDKQTDGKDKAQDGDNRTTPDKDMEGKKIASKAAEERVQAYFSEYAIEKIEYAGETISKGLEAYNFCLQDKDGVKIFAQISQTDGKLIRFDYYKECKDRNFSADSAKIVAEAFLEKLGYKDMTATRLSEFGTDADFLFVKTVDGFLSYPQAVKVKVCEERGVVTGFDASEYLKNGNTMYKPNVKISLAEAQAKLHENLSVVNSQACIIDVAGKPCAAYEFICNYEENTYLVYVDAATGNEISILNVRELA